MLLWMYPREISDMEWEMLLIGFCGIFLGLLLALMARSLLDVADKEERLLLILFIHPLVVLVLLVTGLVELTYGAVGVLIIMYVTALVATYRGR